MTLPSVGSPVPTMLKPSLSATALAVVTMKGASPFETATATALVSGAFGRVTRTVLTGGSSDGRVIDTCGRDGGDCVVHQISANRRLGGRT